MRDPPDMPELEENNSASGMTGINDFAPAPDLMFRIDAGHAGTPETCRHDRRGFCDDQSARCRALRIIFDIQRPGRETGLFRPHPRQGRHHEAMFELVRTDLE